MNGIDLLLVFVALSGFFPLGIFLYKRKKVNRILTTGRKAQARVFHIFKSPKGNYDVVSYYFLATDGKQYQGSLTIASGTYKVNGVIEVYYLPENPKINTVQGAWKSNLLLGFVITVALAILFMTYKIYEMVNTQQM